MTGKDSDTSGYYGNFSDPVGLARRMLGSRDRSAYAALARAALKIGATPLDVVLHRRETRLAAAAQPCQRPVLLVSGGARTGSTLTAQILGRELDVDWLDNRCELFPRSPLVALRYFRRGNARKPELASYYGATARADAPNDAFFLWNRWLGEDRYSPRLDVNTATAADMQAFFNAWCTVSDKVFLNKNNRNLPVLPEIGEMLPQARFVIVSRSPLATVASLVTARKTVHGDVTKPWGIGATDRSAAIHPLGYIDDIVEQIAFCHGANDRAISELGERAMLVRYEDVIADPAATARSIADAWGLTTQDAAVATALEARDGSAGLTDDELRRAENRLAHHGIG